MAAVLVALAGLFWVIFMVCRTDYRAGGCTGCGRAIRPGTLVAVDGRGECCSRGAWEHLNREVAPVDRPDETRKGA